MITPYYYSLLFELCIFQMQLYLTCVFHGTPDSSLSWYCRSSLRDRLAFADEVMPEILDSADAPLTVSSFIFIYMIYLMMWALPVVDFEILAKKTKKNKNKRQQTRQTVFYIPWFIIPLISSFLLEVFNFSLPELLWNIGYFSVIILCAEVISNFIIVDKIAHFEFPTWVLEQDRSYVFGSKSVMNTLQLLSHNHHLGTWPTYHDTTRAQYK
jgi:hypothetical protein